MGTVKVKDKEFVPFLTQRVIEEAIDKIANEISRDLDGTKPLFICVLNGSFMFASELMKRVSIPSELTFVKMSSYSGTSSTGQVKEIYGLEEDIEGRTVVIVEDIVDTGKTMKRMIEKLNEKKPKNIKVATLLLKPDALVETVPLDYVALRIPNDFIIGFGLDYDGYGRNYPDIYRIKD